MNKSIESLKNKLRSFDIKSLSKVAISFFAALLLFSTTACGGSNATTDIARKNLDNPPAGKITELYKPIAPFEGGMNNYSDVDPRVDTSKTDAKAERLIEKAKNLQKQDTNPFKQIQKEFDRKGVQERAGDLSKDLSRSAQETADGLAKGTQKGFSNVQKNAESFKEDVGSTLDDLGQNARNKAVDLKKNAQKTADRVTNQAE